MAWDMGSTVESSGRSHGRHLHLCAALSCLGLFQNSVTRDSCFRSIGVHPPSLNSSLVLFCLYLILFQISFESEGKLILTVIFRPLKSSGCAFPPNVIGRLGACFPCWAQKHGTGFSCLCFLREINGIEHLICLGLLLC